MIRKTTGYSKVCCGDDTATCKAPPAVQVGREHQTPSRRSRAHRPDSWQVVFVVVVVTVVYCDVSVFKLFCVYGVLPASVSVQPWDYW